MGGRGLDFRQAAPSEGGLGVQTMKAVTGRDTLCRRVAEARGKTWIMGVWKGLVSEDLLPSRLIYGAVSTPTGIKTKGQELVCLFFLSGRGVYTGVGRLYGCSWMDG